MKILISNPEKVEYLKSEIASATYKNLYILSDFDRTLTYGVRDGVKTPSLISILRNGEYLTDGYAEKAHALFDKFHPIEIDPKIPLPKKKKEMQNWWESHNELLIKSGLSKKDIKDIVENGNVEFRKGVLKFLDFLNEKNIPLVILSASGCGEAIPLFFKKEGRDYPNIYYLINRFNWDEEGKAVSIRGSVIHSLNKDETSLKKNPEARRAIKKRKNVILLGDALDDLAMAEGFPHKHLLTIGFLNFDEDELRKRYQERFDIVLEGDGDFKFVSDLIKNFS